MKKLITLFFLFIGTSIIGNSQETIKWMSIEEVVEANKVEPKLIFVDVYTNWCGWCKKMDKATFKNPKTLLIFKEENFQTQSLKDKRGCIV